MNDLKGIIEDCNKSDLVSDKVIKKIIEIIGQEEWQDLHDENNDICTTMGELIITLKGIAELEHQLTHRNCLDCSNHSSKLRMRTLELEKENAELKEKLKPENCLKLLAKEGYIKFTSDQLTKAKELLRYYFDCFKNDNKYTLSDFEVVEDTEQFLSEVEK